jgi:hypothetical protein
LSAAPTIQAESRSGQGKRQGQGRSDAIALLIDAEEVRGGE